ncbi:uncharacterized protein [Clytia hemisphaerica]|uniref:uncharacterized protein n=1 Tax=Clytia hemisphaerica TaxID=252671 RepID=UPI0034D71CA2
MEEETEGKEGKIQKVCCFKNVLENCKKKEEERALLLELTQNRLSIVKKASRKRKDNLDLFSGEAMKFVHKECLLEYTSTDHIQRHKRKTSDSHQPAAKRTRRSDTAFDFNEHCLFCGSTCLVQRDPKNQKRWKKNKGMLCRTADRGAGMKTVKETLLEICDKRKDDTSEAVRVRLEGATSDLHAANGRYHVNCYKSFTNERSIDSARRMSANESSSDKSLQNVITALKSDPEKVWNSIEIHNLHIDNGGTESNRSRFMLKLKEEMKDEVFLLSSPGTATIVMLKTKAETILKLENDDEQDYHVQMKSIAEKIVKETKSLKRTFDRYTLINENIFNGSETLLDLLSEISDKLKHSLPAAMIESIVSSTILGKPTMLQVGLSLVAKSREAIDHFRCYGVCSTYQETRRFKVSAAAQNKNVSQFSAVNGLIQAISDNFNASINTQNGIKQTNAMATIVTQTQKKLEAKYLHILLPYEPPPGLGSGPTVGEVLKMPTKPKTLWMHSLLRRCPFRLIRNSI